MKKATGFELLRRQVRNAVEDDLAEMEHWVEGETPIEHIFHAALHYRLRYGRTEYDGLLFGSNQEHAGQLREKSSQSLELIIQSQVQVDKYRVDFVVSAWTYGTVWTGSGWERGERRWRRLIVECDGHEFHERTKEQAARDRSRDRALNSFGYDVFRFTGSELWRDPWACATQVYEWAVRGFDLDPEYPQ